ncbi:hypothetical protein GCM10010193_14480 [Kitasatospora atroaurantiaca]
MRMDPVGTGCEFGSRLRELRSEQQLSLSDLARLLHYSKGYLSKIENGTKPVTPDLARRCDEALNAGGALVRLVTVAEGRTVPPPAPADQARAESPYPGLAAFGPDEARWFFGRERTTASLVDRLAERVGSGALALIAPSGAGKSSLLMAGLLPALRSGALPVAGSADWPVVACTPTAEPLTALLNSLAPALGTAPAVTAHQLRDTPEALADALRPADPAQDGVRLLLLVDQFEETFTLCADEAERRSYIRALTALSTPLAGRRPPAAVLLGVRADFCGRCLEHPELAPVFTHGSLALPPMGGAELRASITRPAEEAGLVLEPGLVELLLRDLGGPDELPGSAAGALPLLSHALRATWQQRQGRVMTVEGYLHTGGIHGAIARTAEDVFTRLGPAEQQAARRLLIRLVHLREGGEETRSRAERGHLLQQLPDDPEAGAAVLDAFVRARLVTADRETVELTHEALLRAWPRLRRWIQVDRTALLGRQQLAEAAAEWEREQHDPALLHRGTKLATAREWVEDGGRRGELGPAEAAFLDASRAAEEAQRRTAERQARRQRRLLLTLAVFLVLTLAAGGVAYQQRAGALTQRREAQSRAMAARSAALAVGRPEAAMLLARAAFRTAPTVEARGALLSTQAQPFLGRLTGHTGAVNAVAFSPDGGLLATAGSDDTVKLWNVADRTLLVTLTGHGGRVRSVAFSPDGATAASAGSDGTVRLWDVAGRRLAATLAGHTGLVRAVAFSPDGRSLVSASADRTVRLWDATTHQNTAVMTGHTDDILSVAFSSDGRTVASGSADRTLRLWDTTTHQNTATLTGHTDDILGVAFSPDGRTIASGSADRTLRLWDTTTHQNTSTLTGHTDDINGVAYTPDGTTLASASGDGTVKLWDVASSRITATLAGHTDYVQGVAVSSRGQLATAGFDQSAVLWDPGIAALIPRPFTEVWKAAFSPDGRLVATADADHAVGVWDVAQRRLRHRLTGHESAVFGVAFSPDGSLLASGSADHTVRLWDVARGRPVATLTGHQGSVLALAFSPDGHWVASASEDRTVRIWDVREQRLATVLTGHADFVNSVAFSPDGRTLATGSDDLTVRLWDTAAQRLTATLTGHTGSVRGLAFNPDGHTLASSGNDGTVRLWDTTAERLTATLTGHTGSVRGLAFNPDGHTLASSGNDGTVRLWDTTAQRLTATLTGHTSAVWGVAFSPDGRTLASSGNDGTVRLWDADPGNRAEAVCRLAGSTDRSRWAQLLPDQPYDAGCPGS